MKFDEALQKYVGSLGCYQIPVLLIVIYFVLPACFVTVDTIFMAATPIFRCAGSITPGGAGNGSSIPTNVSRLANNTLEIWSESSCSGYFYINATKNISGSSLQQEGSLQELSCESYEYDTSVFQSTIATEVG